MVENAITLQWGRNDLAICPNNWRKINTVLHLSMSAFFYCRNNEYVITIIIIIIITIIVPFLLQK